MIDAAGAIYVIGGGIYTGDTKDVWVTTDGGARPGSRRGGQGGAEWVLRVYSRVLQEYYRGTS